MSQPRTVLIIDDDVPFGEFVRAAVESVGHRTAIVTSGADALQAFLEVKPDLILLDLLLPKKDGFKVCEEIRATPAGRNVPVVMMTGIYKKATYEREGLEKYRASAYLIKPFGVREVWGILEKHLGRVTAPAATSPAPASTAGKDLADVPLALQLAAHLKEEDTGVLFVRGPSTTHAVYLRDGSPVFIRSNSAEDRLDALLVRSGKVRTEDVQAAMREVTESRGRVRLGQTLVSRGLLDEQVLATTLQLQLALMLKRVFALPSGQALFVRGEHPTEEDVLLTTDARELIHRGAKITGCEAGLARALPAPHAMLSRHADWQARVGRLVLDHDEARLLQLVDGSVNTERFLAIGTVAGLDAARLLLGFMACGLVTFVARPEDARKPSRATGPWDVTRHAGGPFASALLSLHRECQQGTLTVRTRADGPAKVLGLRDGRLVSVRSEADEDCLADVILQMSLLSEEQIGPVMRALTLDLEHDPDDAAVARALTDAGLLGLAELYWARVYQAMGAVHGLFALPTCLLEWSDAPPSPHDEIPDVPTTELVWEAARSLDEAGVARLLGSETQWYQAASGSGHGAAGLPLSAAELSVLHLLREPLTATLLESRAAAHAPPLDRDEVRRALVGLLHTSAIETIASPKAEPAQATQPTPAPEPVASAAPAVEAGFSGLLEAPDASLDVAAAWTPEPASPAEAPTMPALPAATAEPPAAAEASPAVLAEAPAPEAPPQPPSPHAKIQNTGLGGRFLALLHEEGLDAHDALAEEEVALDIDLHSSLPIPSPDPPAPPPPARQLPQPERGDSMPPLPPTPAPPKSREAGPTGDTARQLSWIQSELTAVRPILSTLRRALDGDARRVEVDRKSMAELFDRLLALCPPDPSRTPPPVPSEDDASLLAGARS